MDMVGHEAPGDTIDTMPLARRRKQLLVHELVAGLQKDVLLTITSLRHVMRTLGYYEAGGSRQGDL